MLLTPANQMRTLRQFTPICGLWYGQCYRDAAVPSSFCGDYVWVFIDLSDSMDNQNCTS